MSFAFCGCIAFHVGRAFNVLLYMDWKETIEEFQVLTVSGCLEKQDKEWQGNCEHNMLLKMLLFADFL